MVGESGRPRLGRLSRFTSRGQRHGQARPYCSISPQPQVGNQLLFLLSTRDRKQTTMRRALAMKKALRTPVTKKSGGRGRDRGRGTGSGLITPSGRIDPGSIVPFSFMRHVRYVHWVPADSRPPFFTMTGTIKASLAAYCTRTEVFRPLFSFPITQRPLKSSRVRLRYDRVVYHRNSYTYVSKNGALYVGHVG